MKTIKELSCMNDKWIAVFITILLVLFSLSMIIAAIKIIHQHRIGGKFEDFAIVSTAILLICGAIGFFLGIHCTFITAASEEPIYTYEITYDDEEISGKTLNKLLQNYQIKRKSQTANLAKVTVEGPRYDSVFTKAEAESAVKN